MDKSVLIALLVCLLANIGHSQHMPTYSLQPALEALHRRDAIALNAAPSLAAGHFPPQPQIEYNDEDVNEPNPSRNAKIDRLIAAYLAKDYIEDEDDGSYFLPEEKKRSSYFRERDEKTDSPPYPSPVMSVFRERDIQPYTQSELADEFLREIEEARDVEREEKYKDALINLWEKYQDQENEIFNEAEAKRTPFMQKKRTYPVLPWLPYSDKRKRFPVAKRSPKVDKQSKDLEEIFGKPSADREKKKRSVSNDMPPEFSSKLFAPSTTSTVGPTEAPHHNHTEHAHHNHSDHKHHRRDEDDQEESAESEEQEHEHDDYEGDSEEEEDANASGEEEDENRKKKRDTNTKMKMCQGHLCMKNKANSKSRQKKSVDWSQYFGLNRKKKSSRPEEDLTPEKIEKLDKKLQLIEDAVLSETVKYTGAQPVSSLADIRRLKENVMSNLATAYSLEKMRQALDTLRQSIENENHLGRNQIEPFDPYDEKAKRLSVKKEKVDFEKNTHDIDIEPDKMKEHVHGGGNAMAAEDNNDEEDDSRRKKRTRYEKYPILPNDIGNYPDELEGLNYEPLNDAYLGNKNYYQNSVGECAIAENIDEKCKNIAVLSGAVNSELLTLCNVHQLCHLCSTTQVGCDFEYINEADRVCGRNSNCLSSVRANIRMLRDSAGPQIGLKECLKIPCLYRLLKDINKR